MNREIKFRAWTGTEMEYSVMVGKFGNFYVNPGNKNNGVDENDSACLSPMNTKYSDLVCVMQFTGMKIKGEIALYEDDKVKGLYDRTYEGIVKFGLYKTNDQAYPLHLGFYIQWSPECDPHESLRKDLGYWIDKIEVIGNIHENKELVT